MRRQRKYNMFLLLVILLLGLTLGYAYLNANLQINGVTNLNKTTWNVHFANIQETSGSVTPNSETAINAAVNTVSFNITLNTPGQFYEFTVDAVNEGTIDGMIETFTSTLNGGSIENLPDCLAYSVTYSDGTAIADNHLLEAGDTETYKVRIEFLENISTSQLPDANQTLNIAFTTNYIQRASSAIPVPHPVETIKYTANMKNIEGSISIGSAIPNGITQYDTAQEARAALNTIWQADPCYDGSTVQFALKHTLLDDVVNKSYIEFVITEDMATANPGLTAGTYTIQGAGNTRLYDEENDYYYFEDIPYEQNKATMLSAFGSSYCTEGSSSYHCSVSGLSVIDDASGHVSAGAGIGCFVTVEGDSGCDDSNW